ncbi:cucumber peeling cupredoxin [Prunus yedoensis var. nudiflora]|uniref:Cucumber peeling cupredoxin n=1 Tax=Prunus yedoensis var. nudiflora TaxID=2094558 RepID=A0A314XPC0_PRUYE|nr:cucumber peeling cupredoxin [Prunus yedoensis var. nudiflora]
MASKLVSRNVRAAVVVIVIAAAAALIIERAEAETHVFEFTTGGHDVARLGKEAFDACNNTNLLSLPENQGPAKYSLNQTGDYYFICAFPGHCSQAETPPPEATTPSSSPPTTAATTAPPPSSASSLASAISTIFMSIAIALFYRF